MQLKLFLMLLLFLCPLKVFAENTQKSEDCSSALARIAEHKNISDHDIVLLFELMTPFCLQSAEFSEWSNEIVFKSLISKPSSFLKQLSNLSEERQSVILQELEHPINDGMDLKSAIANTKKVTGYNRAKARVLLSLERAAGSSVK